MKFEFDSQLPIPRTTLTGIISVYQQAEADIRKAYEMLVNAESNLKTAMLSDSFDLNYLHEHGRSGCPDYKQPDTTMKMLHKKMWRVLIERMELRSLMSIKRAEELDKQLESGEGLPPITEQNIIAMMEGTIGKVQEFMAEAVAEVFNWLRPHRWDDYKTNKQFEIGPKVIKGWCVRGKWHGGGFEVQSGSQKALTALDNVFHLLDGKGSVKSYMGPLCDAISQHGAQGETEYFAFRVLRQREPAFEV